MDERITDLSSLQYNLNMFNSRARMLAYKGALAATLSPFMSLLHPPKHDVNDVKVDHTTRVYIPYSCRYVRDDL